MDAFTALADAGRRDLLAHLARTGPSRVVDLTRVLADRGNPVSRPAVSRHLRVLGEAGLVRATTSGRERHYELVDAGLDPVRAFVGAVGARPPVRPEHLDALDLEVRRTVRDRAGTDHRQRQEETA